MPRVFTYEEPPVEATDLSEYLSRTLQQLETDLIVGEWITPVLLNSWEQYGNPWDTAQYLRTNDGFVHIKGLIRNGTVANGTDLFQLPEGYRPQSNLVFIGGTRDPGLQHATAARIDVWSDGFVKSYGDANTDWLSLSGIHFYAEQ